jgi:hypothetical protein
VVTDLPVGVGAGLVVAGAEIGVPGGGIGEQVPVALCPPCGFRGLFCVLGEAAEAPAGGGGLSRRAERG